MATVVAIVGASKGFGFSLMKACLESFLLTGPRDIRCMFLLITSNRERCIEAWRQAYFESFGKPYQHEKNEFMTVIVEEHDLRDTSCLARMSDIINLVFRQFHYAVNRYFIFFNAGSVTPVGPLLKPMKGFNNMLVDHVNLNFVAFVSLLRSLLHVILKREISHPNVSIMIVNVSSLAAIRNLSGMCVYGAIKAARDAIIQGVADELAVEYPQLDAKLLSYAPGPMETDMTTRDLISEDAPDNFMKNNKTNFINGTESARKCLSLLTNLSTKWKSGAHIDFFDDVE